MLLCHEKTYIQEKKKSDLLYSGGFLHRVCVSPVPMFSLGTN